ncbi:MAG: hypothetical protein JWP85_1743 [Rhodoglobus sp.]|nr:hypothetical protein [Rhodoglobus sp.]
MEKVDFRTERKDLYAPSTKHFAIVDVPEFTFLMIDGRGNPNTSADYVAALEALYALSYTAKFASKNELGRDYVVAPLEGLWWSDRRESFTDRSKDEWQWTMMIRQPAWLTSERWHAARAKAAKKGLSALDAVRLESLREGASIQVMHIGSYDAEAPTIARLHEWIAESDYVENGEHHEIYLGDPRKAAPEKLKTVLRQPVRVR